MKVITCYKAADGNIYESQAQAERVDKLYEFRRHYDEKIGAHLISSDGDVIEFDELAEWIFNHKDFVATLLEAL